MEVCKRKGYRHGYNNPAMVIGPLLQPTLNTIPAAMLNKINGSCSLLVTFLVYSKNYPIHLPHSMGVFHSTIK